jgi:hypothetical protein
LPDERRQERSVLQPFQEKAPQLPAVPVLKSRGYGCGSTNGCLALRGEVHDDWGCPHATKAHSPLWSESDEAGLDNELEKKKKGE